MRSTILQATLVAALVAATASGAGVTRAGEGEGANLVANGDFSQAPGGKPEKWQTSGSARDVDQALEIVKDAEGKPCARLACTRIERKGADSHAMLAQVGEVKLVKGRTYEFSCRARAEGLRGRAFRVAISEMKPWGNAGLYEELPVGGAWRSHRRLFTAKQDVGATCRLQIWFAETGTLYLADVRIASSTIRTSSSPTRCRRPAARTWCPTVPSKSARRAGPRPAAASAGVT